MKFIISTATILFVSICVSNIYAQKPDDSGDSKFLYDWIKTLEQSHKIRFVYDYNIAISTKITNQPNGNSPEEKIKSLLENTGLTYKRNGKTFIIIPSKSDDNIPNIATHPSKFTFGGRVVDAKTKEPLPYAGIKVYPQINGIPTDSLGYFIIRNLAWDTCQVFVSYMGYKPLSFALYPKKEEDFRLILMEQNNLEIKDVVVKEKKLTTITKGESISSFQINGLSINRYAHLGDGDVMKAIQLIPGINATNENNAGLSIHNGGVEQSLILFNSVPLYHIDHFFGVFSGINPAIVDNISIMKSGYKAIYGDRISGVVDITGISERPNKVSGNASLNSLQASLLLRIPIFKKVAFTASVRRSIIDKYDNNWYNSLFSKVKDNPYYFNTGLSPNSSNKWENVPVIPDFSFFDSYLNVNHPLGQKSNICATYYHSNDVLYYDEIVVKKKSNNLYETMQKSQNNRWGNNGLSLVVNRDFAKENTFKFISTYSRYYNQYNIKINGGDLNNPVFKRFTSKNSYIFDDNKIQELKFNAESRFKLNKSSALTTGLQETNYQINYLSKELDSLNIFDKDQYRNYSTAYLQYQLDIYGISLTAGLRNSYVWWLKQNFLEPRLSIDYKLKKKVWLRAAVGEYKQFINRVNFEDLTTSNRFFWLCADKDTIPYLSAYHFVAGINYKSDDFLLDVEFFRKEMDGLLFYSKYNYRNANLQVAKKFVPIENYNQDNLVGYYYNGTGIITGIDVFLQKKTGIHTGYISYCLSETLNRFPGILDGQYFPADQDQRHEVKFYNSLRLKNFVISAYWIYGTGRPYSKPQYAYKFQQPDGTEVKYYTNPVKNSDRLPSYHRLDFSIAYSFDRKFFAGDFGVRIFNVYDRENVKFIQYKETYTQDSKELNVTSMKNINSSKSGYYPVFSGFTEVLLLGRIPNIFFQIYF